MSNKDEDKIKQVVVIRKDLNMRKGKMISQACHASMLFLVKSLYFFHYQAATFKKSDKDYHFKGDCSFPEMNWLIDSFTKITLSVDSEQELLDLYEKASAAGLVCHKVEDNGLTEFHGVKNLTCIAIGPDYSSKIDPLTKDLKLL